MKSLRHPSAWTAEAARRNLIGVLAVLFFAGGTYLWLFPGESAGALQAQSLAWRLGVVLGMWWLAYPVIRRLPGWLWIAAPTAAVIAVVRARWLLLLLPLVIVLALLKPKPKRRQ